MSSPDATRTDLPRWLWLGTPFLILAIQIVTRLGGEASYQKWMRGEVSVPELGTVFWLVTAIAAGAALLLQRARFPVRVLVPWVALFTLGCFLFCGEEMSWGQSYVHWRTPEALASANEQGETNLHNLRAVRPLVDNLPRLVLTIAAMAAVAAPLLARWKPARFGPGTRWFWLQPTHVCVPAALCALLIREFEKLTALVGGRPAELFDMQAGEFKEYFLGMLLALYALSLLVRLPRAAA